MGGLLSFRLAPGVRISASSRGLRAHVGPRAARIHVGGGRTGVSTGAGPFTAYQSLGGSTPRRPTRSASGVTAAQAQHIQEANRTAAELARLGALHRSEFTGPTREVVEFRALPKFGKLLATAEKQALSGTSMWDRSARKTARASGRLQAERWATDLLTLAERERRARQDVIDARWAALQVNDQAAVISALASVFAGRAIRVAGVFDGEVGVVATVPDLATMPDKKPALTPGGAPTLHKLTKTERNEWHAQVVASHVLLAAKETFAHAFAVDAVRVVAVEGSGRPVLAARVQRERLALADWRGAAWPVLAVVAPELRFQSRGRAKDLVPLDLRDDPTFAPVLGATRLGSATSAAASAPEAP